MKVLHWLLWKLWRGKSKSQILKQPWRPPLLLLVTPSLFWLPLAPGSPPTCKGLCMVMGLHLVPRVSATGPFSISLRMPEKLSPSSTSHLLCLCTVFAIDRKSSNQEIWSRERLHLEWTRSLLIGFKSLWRNVSRHKKTSLVQARWITDTWRQESCKGDTNWVRVKVTHPEIQQTWVQIPACHFPTCCLGPFTSMKAPFPRL